MAGGQGVTVGCAGFGLPASRYFREFALVELPDAHAIEPTGGSLRRWRREAPEGFLFVLCAAPALVDGPRDAMGSIAAVGQALAVQTVVLPTEAPPVRASRKAVQSALEALARQFARVVWDPPESWPRAEAEKIASAAGAIVARDPTRDGAPPCESDDYCRLPGPAGHRSRYEDAALERLAERLGVAQRATVVFSNVDMVADASRLRALLDE